VCEACARERVREISQLILDDYLEPRGIREITYREIVSKTRTECKGFYSGDIAKLMTAELAARACIRMLKKVSYYYQSNYG
jgi:hypothetical protein